jgi:hypothetical protein
MSSDVSDKIAAPNGGYRTRRERLLVTVCNLTPVSG